MKTWQIVALSTLVTFGIGGTYLYSVWQHRHAPSAQDVAAHKAASEPTVRMLGAQTFEDVQQLVNTSVWMKHGNAITYFPFRSGHIDFAHRKGEVAPLQRLDIRQITQATVPPTAHDGIEPPGPQIFAIFTMPKDSNYYAVPIGLKQQGMPVLMTDVFFLYDDPHSIYAGWPDSVWKSIDAHQPTVGMTELQVKFAIGRKIISRSGSEEGNRSLTIAWADKLWKINFEDGKATSITSE